MNQTLRLAYIIGTFPALTTTFIDREVRQMRRLGADLTVLSIRRPDPRERALSDAQLSLQDNVIYLLPVDRRRFVASHLYYALLHPLRYWATLLYLLTRPYPGHKARWMTVLHFAVGVYAAFLLREQRWDGLHAHFMDRAATVALVAGRLLHTPYTLSIHAGPDIFVEPVLLAEKLGAARHAVACTAYNKEHLHALLGQDGSSKITSLYHGLDLAAYCPRPIKRGLDGRPFILSVGQLAPRKGFAHLVEACAILRDQGYDFICHIVGEGPQRAELEASIRSRKLVDRVILCGALPHEQVIDKYNQATIFVLPCTMSKAGDMDGIPNVLPEAMAMQVPVVSTTISGIPEIIRDRVEGLLAPPGDPAGLACALAQLLDDAPLREKLARNGRQTIVDKFDVERNTRRLAATLWPGRLVLSNDSNHPTQVG